MLTKTTIILTDEDKYILTNKELPYSPCASRPCGFNSDSCCGCENYTNFKESIKAYKESGLFEYMKKIRTIKEINKKLQTLLSQRAEVFESLPIEVREVVKNLISD